MPAPAAILGLVERFDYHRGAYRSGQYKEAQLCREFLDPLFEALGWDVQNRQGHAEAYKDVIHEDAIKVGGATKAPDYCFRIGGARKFFVEAKKPSVSLKDAVSPAFQLRRYAWSAKLPLSILSDFEEFTVYDCRVRPDKADKASAARVMYLTYSDYPHKWDKIAAVFSREAVLRGSFDRYAESNRARKGTAEVDDAFLREIESWRDLLAHNLALRNPGLSPRQLNFAVQATIDRIVFLRICEDRGIEEYGQLMALLNSAQVYERMGRLFRRADERYDSGLFHFCAEKERPDPPDDLTLSLAVDDKPLKDIVKGLYYPDSPYEFSVLPADILGQVYEQFLGKVIRLTPGHRAVVEDKPEVKKAGGVYYTPTYIVDYIVRNTLGRLLEGKTVKQVDQGRRQGATLRILDPACGSGSFLLGAYQYLLDWCRDGYVADGPEKWAKGRAPRLFQASGGDWRLTTPERKRILLDHIYGVDIDPQAVEVTKLSLLLKVLEGENEQTLTRQLALFHERALPDLGHNVKCGNSLIGPDFYAGRQTGFLDEEEHYRVNAFDWETEFPDVFRPARSQKTWQVSLGFDVVIGNPPYGAYLYEAEKAYLNSRFTCQSYQLDSYLLFLERCVRYLLADNGFYGMIIPNPWLTNLLQTNTRRFVTESTRLVEIVHFRFPVFPKATVDTEIVILQKSDPTHWQPLATIVDSLDAFQQPSALARVRQIRHEQDKWRALDGGVINIFMSLPEYALADKCLQVGISLSSLYVINVGIKPYQVGKGKPPQTKEVVEKRIYDSDHPTDSSYRLYLRGSDIGRYKIAPLASRYLKYGHWLAEPRPAADFDAPLKIVMRQTGDSLVATVDTDRYLCLNNMHVLVPTSSEPATTYVLGIINSRLLNWYYHTLNPEVGEALAEVKKTNVARLPIRPIAFSDPADRDRHDRLVALVERMLALHKQLAAARTAHEKTALQRQIAATDQQIDALVYELYGLTEEEIKIVEGQRS